MATETNDRIASKLHSILPSGLAADLRGSSIVLGGGVSVTVDDAGVCILGSYGATFEALPSGLSFTEIANHIAAAATGTTGAHADSKVMLANGNGWVMAA